MRPSSLILSISHHDWPCVHLIACLDHLSRLVIFCFSRYRPLFFSFGINILFVDLPPARVSPTYPALAGQLPGASQRAGSNYMSANAACNAIIPPMTEEAAPHASAVPCIALFSCVIAVPLTAECGSNARRRVDACPLCIWNTNARMSRAMNTYGAGLIIYIGTQDT